MIMNFNFNFKQQKIYLIIFKSMKDEEKSRTLGQFRQNIKHYQQEVNAKLKLRQEQVKNANAFNEQLKQLINAELKLFEQLERIQKLNEIIKYVHVQSWGQIQTNLAEIQNFIKTKYACCCSNQQLDKMFNDKDKSLGDCAICLIFCVPCCIAWKCCLCCADCYDALCCDCFCKCSCNTHQCNYSCCCCLDCCLSQQMKKWRQVCNIYKKYSQLIQIV